MTLTATADPGYTFTGWTGDASGTTSPFVLEMNGDKAVSATYTQDQYTLTVTSAHGPVTKEPNQATYTHGTDVTLTMGAIDPGWTFTGWDYAGCTGTGPCTVTMNANTTVTANFTQDAYTLEITIVGSGSVTTIPDQLTYTYGTPVELTAVPDPGHYFTGWEGDLGGSDNPATITIYGNSFVSATFEPIPPTCYALTLTHTGSGSDPVADLANSIGCAAGKYIEGEILQLSGADPEDGWEISGWTGTANNGSTGPTNTVTMPASAHIAAVNYTHIVYTLTEFSEHGDVAIDPAAGPYYYGNDVTLTMGTVDAGWTFTGWSEPGCTGTGPCTVTILGNTEVTANFTQNVYALNITQATGGVITAAPAGPYHWNDPVTVTADPDDGWSFGAWTGDCAGQGNPCTLTMDCSQERLGDLHPGSVHPDGGSRRTARLVRHRTNRPTSTPRQCC